MPSAFDYAPSGWMPCDGRLLQVSQYTALFSLIGSKYGGNGSTTFGLPDLRGRALVGSSLTPPPPAQQALKNGQVVGSNSTVARITGGASFMLTADNLPGHTHAVNIASEQLVATSTFQVTKDSGVADPTAGAALGTGTTGAAQAFIYAAGATPDVALNAASIQTTVADVSVTSTSSGGASQTAVTASIAASSITLSSVQPSCATNFIICVEGLYPDFP
ncbi:phage tail protein [Massilia sp. CFBP9026]|uniref:phage tail protein n=1 Tax=Massilia sp. CFBP9026 TaxID=3096536 RepID=UPI002A6AEE31|nr:tail fiber protein [Massilia sp. CFBP9026]MDY0961651.1 tail fiber protein [Massilia sp. CFBP9026]